MAMREEVRRFAAALTGAAALPPRLDAAIARLEASAWPEVATCWSLLTPGGCREYAENARRALAARLARER